MPVYQTGKPGLNGRVISTLHTYESWWWYVQLYIVTLPSNICKTVVYLSCVIECYPFDNHLQQLEKQLQEATTLILEDRSEGQLHSDLLVADVYSQQTYACTCSLILLQIPEQDRLFYTVHEKSSIAEGSVIPHLWTYRSRISLEHLFQTLQAQDKRKECPILYQFLNEVGIISLTQLFESAIIFSQSGAYITSHSVPSWNCPATATDV